MSVIVLLVEGATEKAAKEKFKEFLDTRYELSGKPKVGLETRLLDSRLLKKDVVCDMTQMALSRNEVNGVVELMDVKCAGRPNRFRDARETISFLRSCVPNEPRYRAHAAQYDFEAWLLPYWKTICKKLKVQKKRAWGKSGTCRSCETSFCKAQRALPCG